MFYLVEDINGFIVILNGNGADSTYNNLKRGGFKVNGQFERLDYAESWQDGYNLEQKKQQTSQATSCLESADFIGGDKYICRPHDSDMYIEEEFWETETDIIPECET